MILGRLREEHAISELVEGVEDTGGALLLIGEPGIGKSTLIALARKQARRQGLRVLYTTGVPTESRLPYAGLHQLLLPLREHLDALSGPQRDAILTAFGKGSGPPPDRFLVALAVTELLGEAAAREPLLILIDDAHWLDPATCDALAFLARRIMMEPIVMLAGLRDGYDVPLLEAGLPELRLEGLDESSARELIDAHTPALPDASRQEILKVAVGNPLALSELALSVARAETSAATLASGALAPTARIEKAFGGRLSDLPAETQTLLLVAALNEGGSLGETLRAASAAAKGEIGPEALAPALSARLIETTSTGVRFCHPLVRSAIEQRTGLAETAAAHLALADVFADQPDRRAWHRAAAALEPDENVAAELDAAAQRAEQRAAIPLAITAGERAAELSRDPAHRNRRLLHAARLSFELGRPAAVQRIVGQITRADLGVLDRAGLALLQENLEDNPSEGAERVRHLVELSVQVADAAEHDTALDLLLGAARRCWWDDPGREARLLVAGTAERIADSPLHPTLQSVLAFAAPDEYGAVVRDRLTKLSGDPGLDASQLTHLGIAGTILGAFERSRVFFSTAIPLLRSKRRLGLLVRALNHEAYCAIHTCDWPAAREAAEESERVAAEAGQHRWVALAKVPQAVVAALLGQVEAMETLASESERVLLPAATRSAMAYLQIARGLAALGAGNYNTAYDHLVRIYDPGDHAFNHLLRFYALADLADAAVHSGHREEARRLADGLADGIEEPSPVVLVNRMYAEAILAEDDVGGELLERAITDDLRPWPFYYARLKLEYGGWLRRHRRSADSRPHLRTARDMLEAVGATAWRDRADQELRASGVKAQAPREGRLEELTAQEEQIARLVLAGLSNREIGERLCLSHRTVAYHLYRMFPKLGITSRGELRAVLAER